ncbi:complement C1q tumor necrosis factor-related protein 3-like [Saccostrea cucullata]|uniref:complement C1q tumor necrosis factor-related protein 3-like n=1 Tax=Saccostrea cuccullata TaxID=36930 RepID=UPI002ED5E1C9
MEEMFLLIERQNAVIERQSIEIKNLKSKVHFLESKSGLGIVEDRTGEVNNNKINKTEGNVGNVDVKRPMHDAETKRNQIRRFLSPSSAEGHVAFYAYISKDFGGVGVDHVFLYDTVVTNYGNAYNKHTGAFMAPTTGVYAFSYTIYAAGEHVAGETGAYGEVSVKLVHNGAYKGSIYVDTETQYEEEMSTGFAILMLQAGDVVLTKTTYRGQGSFHSNESGRWSFAGFQIA